MSGGASNRLAIAFKYMIEIKASSDTGSTGRSASSPEEKFREFLEIRGEKLTDLRRVLLGHIFDSHKHFDADELVAELRSAGRKVSRATVYRTLRLLVEAGLLRELRLTNRTAYEHQYGYPSHDHLHCTTCHEIIEFENDAIRRLRDELSREHGYLAGEHRFVIEGTCPACLKSRTAGRRLDLI